MDDIFVYTLDLPDGCNEMVAPCADGYTIYIDRKLDRPGKLRAFRHAIDHIIEDDFCGGDVQYIESVRH